MGRWASLSCFALLAQAALATAQPAAIPATQAVPTARPVASAGLSDTTFLTAEPSIMMDGYADDGARLWGNVEYLLWKVSDGPLPLPLVTTGTPGNVASRRIAAIGGAGTQVLFGNQTLDYGTFSGLRAAIGAQLGDNVGFEISGLRLEERSTGFQAASNAAGSPVLGIPYFGPNTSGGVSEVALNISNAGSGPTLNVGAVSVSSSSSLWGDAATGVFTLIDSDTVRWSALVGFRYLDLSENLDLEAVSTVVGGPDNYKVAFIDAFTTRNQFYGGEVGSRFSTVLGRFAVDLTAKLALGSMHEVVGISGANASIITAANPPARAALTGPANHGLFAQATNSGRRTSDEFAVVPEVGVKFGYGLTQRLTAYAGYDFIYLSRVVRPGDQIDRNINGPVPPPPPMTGPIPPLATTGHPSPLFNQTDFWAYGISFGLEFRY